MIGLEPPFMQIGGYARACRRGRRPRSAIIGGMLEAERHQQGATVAQTYLIAAT